MGWAAIFSHAAEAFSRTSFWVGTAAVAEARADSRAAVTLFTASSLRLTPRALSVSMLVSMSVKYSSRAWAYIHIAAGINVSKTLAQVSTRNDRLANWTRLSRTLTSQRAARAAKVLFLFSSHYCYAVD